MREKPVHIPFCKLARMPALVKQEEAAYPVHIGLFGTATIMPGSQDFHRTVVKPGRRLPWEQPQRPSRRRHRLDYTTARWVCQPVADTHSSPMFLAHHVTPCSSFIPALRGGQLCIFRRPARTELASRRGLERRQHSFSDLAGGGRAAQIRRQRLAALKIEARGLSGKTFIRTQPARTSTTTCMDSRCSWHCARPVFVDSDYRTWNLDPNLLERALRELAVESRRPRVLMVVHLCGQSADRDLGGAMGTVSRRRAPFVGQ